RRWTSRTAHSRRLLWVVLVPLPGWVGVDDVVADAAIRRVGGQQRQCGAQVSGVQQAGAVRWPKALGFGAADLDEGGAVLGMSHEQIAGAAAAGGSHHHVPAVLGEVVAHFPFDAATLRS